ncbi:tap domain-containing protein [Pochonia chlamydosporia 170]|uniref:Tap domain-containing protein n=1 Tax=Pochonia chlamydosporia 170 TaxID=1380566 RepID=A0A179FZA3_METCM|nr:tap domain-containing protein [Pochonia chlamydosporia 170]OAQ70942.1 tap domain-containing protein [Pochonia chlamydosporia 170]
MGRWSSNSTSRLPFLDMDVSIDSTNVGQPSADAALSTSSSKFDPKITMKNAIDVEGAPREPPRRKAAHYLQLVCLVTLVLCSASLIQPSRILHLITQRPPHEHSCQNTASTQPIYGQFPKSSDPFHFLPCTNETVPPSINDTNAYRTWAALYNPDPRSWIWEHISNTSTTQGSTVDPYAGRGIYLCGYLDVPLDYTNKSDTRISRLAITKFQVSGLARLDGHSPPSAGRKSERTLIIEPGGPGGSGTLSAFRSAEDKTKHFSNRQYDVLGWDPRGVNISQPSISCFPYNADRDRWALLETPARVTTKDTRAYLEAADAFHDATLRACWERHGDIPRFLTTTFVVRDLEEIRIALDEPEITGYFVSYGTTIGEIYSNMFPSSVGRLALDGVTSARDDRKLGGFSLVSLDNITDAWNEGFLGECVHMGPKHCALARPVSGQEVTLQNLQARMEALMASIAKRPIPGYTPSNGPTLITYARLNSAIFSVLYDQKRWPHMAKLLFELEQGNSTLAAEHLDEGMWSGNPDSSVSHRLVSGELGLMVICSDSYDAPQPSNGLEWWDDLWKRLVKMSWIGGDDNFMFVFPCRQFTKYWPQPAEVYRGDFNNTLKNPILLISETHDPATPISNGRRMHKEMGRNSRLVVHHGYGHSSQFISNCTNSIVRNLILNGVVPDEAETDCYAEVKPYKDEL